MQELEKGRREEALEAAAYFVEEARVIFGIYNQWLPSIRKCLADKGLTAEALAREEARLTDLIVLRYPHFSSDRGQAWQFIEQDLELLRTSGDEQATAILARLRDKWRELHDSDVDYIAGLMDVVIRHFGEEAIGEMYEGWVIGDWFEKRYAKFDTAKHSWAEIFEELVFLSFESMHAHLAGPNRDGSVDFEEFADRVTLRFHPCGSGGRTVGGDPLTGRAPLMEPPFDFGVLERPHDFAWNTAGICAYCAHCCVILEKLPMEHFGYPVRVVEPPVHGSGKPAVCSWTIYRDPRDVPAEVYERLGKRKPSSASPLGSSK
ncbi:MAG: hypothetical protein AB7F09_09400 [Parvibaculaceae bacterium]